MAQGKRAESFTVEALEALAVLNPTANEIAAVFRVSRNTVMRYLRKKDYAEALERGKENRITSLKRAQWRSAIEKGNIAMQIWLGKNELGQRDQAAVELSGAVEQRIIDAPPRPATYEEWQAQRATRLDEELKVGRLTGSNGHGEVER
jgi:hypothetical protein